MGRRFTLIAAVCGLLAATGCLVPPNQGSRIATPIDQDAPDPAGVIVAEDQALVYASDAVIGATGFQAWAHVPAYHVSLSSTTPTPSGTGDYAWDALPVVPAVSNGVFIWAPSVRKIGSTFVMVFSMSEAGRANCIGWATSTSGITFMPRDDLWLCSDNPSIGFLDPYLFTDPASGQVWLLYSEQGAALNSIGGSDLVAQPLNSDGLGVPTNSYGYRMITFKDVKTLIATPGPLATNVANGYFIENPSMTVDTYNNFDLTFSMGNWRLGLTYITAELPCLAVNYSCLPTQAAKILNQGGASAITDGSPASNWLLWHDWITPTGRPPIRVDFSGPTTEENRNSTVTTTTVAGVLLAQGSPVLAVSPSEVVKTTWSPRAQGQHGADRDQGYRGPPMWITPGLGLNLGPGMLKVSRG